MFLCFPDGSGFNVGDQGSIPRLGRSPEKGIELTSPALQADSLLSQSVQFSRSVVSDSLQLQGLQHARLPWSLLKLMSIESVIPSNNLILCHPLLLSSIFPSIRVFSRVGSLHEVAKVLEF